MRSLYFLLLVFCCAIVACGPGGQGDQKDTVGHTANSSPVARNDSAGGAPLNVDSTLSQEERIMISMLKKRYKDASVPFPGLWVSERYVQGIRQGRSTRESQDTDVSAIVIPGRTFLPSSMIFGFHEGGEGLVLVKQGEVFVIRALNDGRLIDTILSLPDGRLAIGSRKYVRVGEADKSLYDFGVLEQLLYEGKYRLESEPGAKSAVTGDVIFKANGMIEGLDTLRWYEPEIDYTGEMTNVDHLRLGRDKNHLTDYGVRFSGDTLKIYTIKCLKEAEGAPCVRDTLDLLMYSFVKVRRNG